MKGILLTILVCGVTLLTGISLFEIQYTTNPGIDNTYPSRYVGKTVSVEGVVTATNYQSGGFFISEPAGGPWRSIYIRMDNSGVRTGDKVMLKGIVDEYFGMTCINDVKGVRVLDSSYPLSLANQLTTGQITTPDQAEAYESTLVKVRNSSFIQNQGTSSYTISDGSGPCLVGSMFNRDKSIRSKSASMFTSLTGVVCYAFSEYSINPRNSLDSVVMVPVFNQNRSWGRIKSIYR